MPSWQNVSQPSWAAWIEIQLRMADEFKDFGRSPLGLRGLKFTTGARLGELLGVAAHSGCVD